MSTLITPNQILCHIQTYLPFYTDRFSDLVDIQSAEVISGDTVRVTTNSAHGLTAGYDLIVVSGLLENPIVSVQALTDSVIFTTSFNHDFITPSKPNDLKTLTLSGFTDVDWNGEHDIITVPTRKFFEIPIPEGASVPTLTGSEIVYEDRPAGLKGVWEIVNIPSSTQFDFEVTGRPSFPINTISNLKIASRVFIHRALDIQRAEELYTKGINQADNVAFLIAQDVEASRDRHTLNDSIMSVTTQNEARLMMLTSFSTVVFFKTTDQIAGNEAQELAYGEVFDSLTKAVYGMKSENNNTRFLVISNGHGAGKYNTAYYTHVYEWQLPEHITYKSGFRESVNVALRRIEYTLHPFDLENVETLELNIDFDNT